MNKINTLIKTKQDDIYADLNLGVYCSTFSAPHCRRFHFLFYFGAEMTFSSSLFYLELLEKLLNS